MVKEWIVEFSAGVSVIAVGTFLLVYVRRVKDKLRKFILRHGQDEKYL